MNKVEVYCSDCNKKYVVNFKEISELYQKKCKYCKSDNIFYREFKFEEPIDKKQIKFGDRGCGTPNRFM